MTQQQLPIGTRVALRDSKKFTGTIVDYHRSTYGPPNKRKNFFGYKINWDKGSIGICELNDLTILQ